MEKEVRIKSKRRQAQEYQVHKRPRGGPQLQRITTLYEAALTQLGKDYATSD